MICKELARYIDPYLDDEISVIDNLRAQAHLVFCSKCRAVVESEVQLRSLIEADALEDSAPEHLREKILQKIGESGAQGRSRTVEVSTYSPRIFFAGLLAGAVTLGIILALATYLFKGSPGDVSALAAEIVGKHQTYSRGEQSLQLRSSDSNEVTSWLGVRLGFSVRLPQLARPGERLVGARLSSIADGQAAYLLYERMGRKTSLFIFRSLPTVLSSGSAKSVAGVQFFTSTLEGYPVVWWEDQDRYYAAISDSGINDLIEFGLLCVKGKAF